MLALLASRTGRLPLIDGANLLFHEAGHPIFAMIHRDLGVYGGTLAQLLIPLICMIAFLRQRAVVSAAVALLWMFQNFFGISAYMADARDQALPMVGGGQHDWTTIFALWGVLEHDREIAAAVRFLAWAGLTATAVGVALLWWRGQQTLRSVETPPPPPKRPAGKNTI